MTRTIGPTELRRVQITINDEMATITTKVRRQTAKRRRLKRIEEDDDNNEHERKRERRGEKNVALMMASNAITDDLVFGVPNILPLLHISH